MLTATPSLYAPLADPQANDPSALETFKAKMEEMPIPESVEGYELDEEDAKAMRRVHPEGEEVAAEVRALSILSASSLLLLTHRVTQVLRRFLETKARSSQLGPVSPLAKDAQPGDSKKKDSRIAAYADGRNEADKDTTSRMSCVPLHSSLGLH